MSASATYTASGGTSPLSSITLAANTTAASLVVAAGEITKLVGPGNRVLTITGTFSIATGGVLDIGDNHLVLQSATGVTEAALQAMVNSGRLVCQRSKTKTVGILDNADFGYTHAGDVPWPIPAVAPTLNADDMIVGFVLWGDCTFDGLINSDDFNQIVAGLSSHSTKWVDGNFRYVSTGPTAFDFATFNIAYAGGVEPTNHDNWVGATGTVNFDATITTGSVDSRTISAPAASVGDTVAIGLPAASTVNSGFIFQGVVTSAGTVTIYCTNFASAGNPGSLTVSVKTSAP